MFIFMIILNLTVWNIYYLYNEYKRYPIRYEWEGKL